jgi:hypothetical protein
MHDHRNESPEATSRRANTPPPVGSVRGLGYVDVLRIELPPAQLPWLVDLIDELRTSIETDTGFWRARTSTASDEPDGPSDTREAEKELERLAYKLEVLEMIRRQLPAVGEGAADPTASPWDEPCDDAPPEPDLAEAPLVVVGPAPVMTQLIEGAAINIAETLGSWLQGPTYGVDVPPTGASRPSGASNPGLTPAIAEKLRATAAAARTYINIYVDLMLQQGYKFDPNYEPIHFDEFE